MPASISQHRTSTGIYQNKLHDNLKSNAISARDISSNISATPDEICQFGNSLSQIVNSHQSLYRPLSQSTISQPGITAPLLMLLSLVRLSDSPPQVKSDHSVIIYGEESLPVPPENTTRPNNSGNIFSTILNPVANILYETGQFISQYDPLIFPGTDATTLPLKEIKPETNISFFSDKLIRKIREKIDSIASNKDKEVAIETIDKLNQVAIEAEKKLPPNHLGYKSIEHLIYLIDKSKHIIDDFEIKHSQKNIYHELKSQQESYIRMAKIIPDEISTLKFKKYIESIPLLTFTSDRRGEYYPSVENQIAGSLIRSFFWLENEQGHSAVYGHRYNAHKSLLTCLLAEKKINDVNKLPTTWYKGDEAIRLVNLFFHDIENNLKNKGEQYFLKPAEMFYLSLREEYIKDSVFDIKGLEGKALSSYSENDKLLVLMHYFNQPVEIEYNQETGYQKIFKLLEFFMTLQSIAVTMRLGILSESHYHNFKPKPGTSAIHSDHSPGRTNHLHFEYNNKNQKLTINPVNKNHAPKKNDLQIQDLINDNTIIKNIKFTTNPSLLNQKKHSYISKDIRKKINPETYVKDIITEHFSAPDNMGLRYDSDGKSYLKIKNGFVRVYHMESHPDIKNRYFIKNENKENVYLRFRKDNKFHFENHN